MDTQEHETVATLDFLKNYWVIIVCAVGLILTFGNVEYRLVAAEAAIVSLQAQNQIIASHLASIDVNVAEINVSLRQLTK